ncbi:MAG: hypothetical protein RJA22_2952, partial [Verrucomicrobiota bacterium]
MPPRQFLPCLVRRRFWCVAARWSGVLLGLWLTMVPVRAAEPVLSEFMAENKSVRADQDGEFSDWIEIYNP